ncbi:MAG: hypothetical protein MJE77_10570 [Proteobacteria bacterium]|nr:hypothetical protein [Pseudomonadota bacterium]
MSIPPYLDCRDPLPGDTTDSPTGKVCTNVHISGATEEGKRFEQYASCDVVRTQRPYWPAEPKGLPSPTDPRLQDQDFMTELAWVTDQLRSTGCVCCHSSSILAAPSQWDIEMEGIWTDALDSRGAAIMGGQLASQMLGHYPSQDNNGFDRDHTGMPTTDVARMQAFFRADLERRGVTQEEINNMEPLGGGFIDAILNEEPTPCEEGQGVNQDGTLTWTDNKGARYVYVMNEDSSNPRTPPNHVPEGTLWLLQVSPSDQPVASGLRYGSCPPGASQTIPSTGEPPALVRGQSYHLYVLEDVLKPITNCTFTY